MNSGAIVQADLLFEKEELPSAYAPPQGWKVKPWQDQLAALKEIWPVLDGSNVAQLVARSRRLPEGAEGLIVVPKFEPVARLTTNTLPVFNRAMWQLLIALKDRGYCFGCYLRGSRLGSDLIRPEKRTARFLRRLEAKTPGDFLVLSAQSGIRHRGRSVRRTRALMAQTKNEFGLDSFSVGCFLLVHPERLTKHEDLRIDCPGTEYSWGRKGIFNCAPLWLWGGDSISFAYGGIGRRSVRSFGSMSAFLP